MKLKFKKDSYRASAAFRCAAVVLTLAAALLPSAVGAAQAAAAPAGPYVASGSVQRRAEDVLKTLSTEEKIGQLSQIFFFGPSASLDDRIRKGQLGSVLFTTDPKQINRMQRIAIDESPHHIPLLFGFDVIHGLRTVFPVPIAMAASWDPSVAEEAQRIAASEARAVGVEWTFAPMVDIARDARWGRIVEGAGEDPFLGSAMARAQVLGFQGQYVGQSGHLLATVKHFAGYGAAEGGRDYDAANVSDAQMWNVYLPPFKAAIDAGVGTVMSAYMDLNDVPATGNRWLLHDVLRKQWDFHGFVVSDADAVKSLKTHGFAVNNDGAALRAFNAGVNMEMATGSTAYSTGLAAAVHDDRIDARALDEAVRPILEEKVALGLFEHPYAEEPQVEGVLHDPTHLVAARVAAEKSTVLLRNEDALLPLKAAAYKRIAAIGPFADARADLLGPWALAADPGDTVTIAEGVRHLLGGDVVVDTAPGVQLARKFPSPFDMLSKEPRKPLWTDAAAKEEFAKAIETAKSADLILVALGELQSMSGESASVSSLEFAGQQEQLLEAAVATGKPVVLILVNGRPLDIRWAMGHVSAVLEAWFPGTQGGAAIADILFGRATPGGKLPFTWPRDAGQLPLYYAHNTTQAPNNQGKRYWNEDSTPLLPFGFGLSYASFGFSNLRVDPSVIDNNGVVSVSVDVENQSKVQGDEVAQLYIHQQSGSSSRPVRELKGFQRVYLGPMEKKTLRFSLDKQALSYWSSATRSWVSDPVVFDVWVGGDSDASLHGSFSATP
jgi:beta-glucosidase